MTDTPADLIKTYNETKAFIDAEVKRFEEYSKPFKEKLNQIANQLLAVSNQQGVNSFSTEFGTAYRSTILNTKIEDREKYVDFVLDHWDDIGSGMLQVGVTKDAVKQYMDDNAGQPPPGITISYYTRINVNRG